MLSHDVIKPFHVAFNVEKKNILKFVFFFVSRASDLVDQLRKKSHFFKHNHVLFPFGDDFRFRDHDEWSKQFDSLTKIMDFVNARPDLHIQVNYLFPLFLCSLNH